MKRLGILVVLAGLGSAAWAHSDVKSPTVLARMEGMTAMSASIKELVNIYRSSANFDADRAGELVEQLRVEAAAIPEHFEKQETEPASEAKPLIWEEWDRFAEMAEALSQATLAMDASSAKGVQDGVQKLSVLCRDCHQQFRE